jgi:hypothetical protein
MNPKGNITSLNGWKPGQSGNPAGRPKGPSLLKELLKELDQLEPGTKRKKVRAVAVTLIDRAIDGDMGAQQLVWRYVEGNPTQPVDMSGEIGVTVQALREAMQRVS